MGRTAAPHAAGLQNPCAPLFEFRDPADMHGVVSRILCPYRTEVGGKGRAFDARVTHLPAGALSLCAFSYGHEVAVDPGCLRDFYLIQMVVAGEEKLRYGDAEFRLPAGAVSVISPDVPLRKTSAAGTRKLLLRVDRGLLERSCAQHLGHGMKRELTFDVVQSAHDDGGGALKRLLVFLQHQLAGAQGLSRSPLMIASIEQMVANSLLLLQKNNYSAELDKPEPPAMPGFVRSVESYIEENADRPITIGDLAAHAGVSTRSLFVGFQRYRNTTPMQKLRHVRLQRAREELLSGGGTCLSVAEVASRWGFAHLGRFAEQYRRHFGELPSGTLSRVRARGTPAS
jgi:AraC-like DNA-binding protein